MRITIVTAGFRVEGVQKIIECVDNQTYKDWQHIIVNDNSQELREWYQKEGYKHFDNGKRYWVDMYIRTHWFGAIARNIGVMIAFSYFAIRRRNFNDEWICFLDDDNLWLPEHLETLVAGHNEKPEATLIGVDMEMRGCQDKNYRKIVKCSIKANHCDLGSFLYNRKLFDKYGHFQPRPERTITFDFELIQKMAQGEGEDKVHFVHKPTFIFNYRKA